MLMEEKLQREVVRLLNRWDEGFETELLELLVKWMEQELISPYKIVYRSDNYAVKPMWELEKRR